MVVPAQRLEEPSNSDAVALTSRRRIPLVSTKLNTPRVPAYRDRPRLSARLDGALNDATRLTLLSAPPGYGKSAAVSGWLASRGIDSAWLSLDAADNDPVRFARYLVGALERVRPGVSGTAPALLEGLAGAEAAAFLIDAIGLADDPFVLVLDDYHVILAEPVHALLRALIEQGPPFAHLVVITREDPPFPLPRLRAHHRLVEVRADELRYLPDEASAYLGESSGLELDERHIHLLVERTEGWIAGLQLAAISLRGRAATDPLVDAFSGSQRYVLDYLAAEVLARLDPDLRRFLAQISVVDRFTAGLCRALSGREDSAALLERAERLNLFIIPLDLEGRWFRFHHLFADYLRTLLDPAEQTALRERAAEYLEDADLLDEAIGHAIAARSIDRAVRLLERGARRTYEAGELTTLLSWLDALPRNRVAASGELVSLRACASFFVGHVEDAARTCAEGEASHPDDRAPGPLLAVRALIAAFASRPEAVGLAQAALEALGTEPHDTFFLALARQAIATGQLSAGQLESATGSGRLAFESIAGSGRSMLVSPALTALVSALILTGRRGEAEDICRRALADHRDEARHLAGGTPYELYWLGMARYEANDLSEALPQLERAWSAAGTFGFGRAMLTTAVAYLALARQATGSPDGALEAVRTVLREARAAGLAGMDDRLNEIEARLRLTQGDLTAAARWADGIATDAIARHAPGWASLQADATLARVRLAQGRPADARVFLDAARAAATAAHDTADLISIRVLEAALADAIGSVAAAQRSLEEAVRLAAPEGYVRRLVDDGRSVAHLLPAVRRVAPAFVDEVIAAFAGGSAPDGTRPGRGRSAFWQDEHGQPIEALTARELEILRLLSRGYSDAAVAGELVVSLATAKWHAAHVRSKLGARSRTQALARARELGLI